MFKAVTILISCFLIVGCSGYRYEIISLDRRSKQQEKLMEPYSKNVLKEIYKRHKALPKWSEYAGEKTINSRGTIRVIIRSNGFIDNIEVLYPEWYKGKDVIFKGIDEEYERRVIDAAIQAVKDSEPFNPIPQETGFETFTIFYTFYYPVVSN